MADRQNAFAASGSPPPRAEQARLSFKNTVVDLSYQSGDFGTYNITSDHLGGASGTLVTPRPEQAVVVYSIMAASQAAAAQSLIATLAEEGSSSDIVVIHANQFGVCNVEFPTGIKLAKGKDLIIWRAQGDDGGVATADFNSVTVSYSLITE